MGLFGKGVFVEARLKVLEVVLAELAPAVALADVAPETVLVEVPKIGTYTVLQNSRTRDTKRKTK